MSNTPSLADPELLRSFADDIHLQDKSQSTVENYRDRVEKFAAMHGDVPVTEVGRDEVRSYLQTLRNRGIKASTEATYFAALGAFWDFLLNEGYVDSNPVAPVRKRYVRSANGGRRMGSDWYVPTVAEVREMIQTAADPCDRAAIILLAKTGMRNGTLRAIRPEDIDLDDHRVDLEPGYCEKRKGRLTVFFDDEAERVLRSWLRVRPRYADGGDDTLFLSTRGNRLRSASLRRYIVQKHAERVGIHDPDSDDRSDRVNVHSFRHFFTDQLRKSDCPDYMIRLLRGDKVTDVLDRYTNPTEDQIREAYDTHVPKLHLGAI